MIHFLVINSISISLAATEQMIKTYKYKRMKIIQITIVQSHFALLGQYSCLIIITPYNILKKRVNNRLSNSQLMLSKSF